MNSEEISEMLDTLYLQLVNEIDVSLDGFLDDKTTLLAEAIKNAVKHTRESLYGTE